MRSVVSVDSVVNLLSSWVARGGLQKNVKMPSIVALFCYSRNWSTTNEVATDGLNSSPDSWAVSNQIKSKKFTGRYKEQEIREGLCQSTVKHAFQSKFS